uniref:Putative secreted protein n=1 Tax=Amblyomma triste TaxID=251400 RepID=A0A023G422_AMBTT
MAEIFFLRKIIHIALINMVLSITFAYASHPKPKPLPPFCILLDKHTLPKNHSYITEKPCIKQWCNPENMKTEVIRCTGEKAPKCRLTGHNNLFPGCCDNLRYC